MAAGSASTGRPDTPLFLQPGEPSDDDRTPVAPQDPARPHDYGHLFSSGS